MTPVHMIAARIAVRLGINLNWVFSPATSFRKREPLRLNRRRENRA